MHIIEQVPTPLRLFYKEALWRMESKSKCLYLTFDDGPTDENTKWILDLLDTYSIKGTFFCIGKNVEAHPDLYKEIISRGHSTGLHGYDHKRGLYKDENKFIEDLAKAENLITSHLFRPPHGLITRSEIRKLSHSHTIVLWDLLTRDYDAGLSGNDVLSIAKKYARNGSIIVFHDSIKAQNNMRYALPRAIEYWITEGYKFDKL